MSPFLQEKVVEYVGAAASAAAVLLPFLSPVGEAFARSPVQMALFTAAAMLAGAGVGVAARKRFGQLPSRSRVRSFSRAKASAALTPVQTGGWASPSDEALVTVEASVRNGEGIFLVDADDDEMRVAGFCLYTLADPWRRFLSRPRNLRLLEEVADGR